MQCLNPILAFTQNGVPVEFYNFRSYIKESSLTQREKDFLINEKLSPKGLPTLYSSTGHNISFSQLTNEEVIAILNRTDVMLLPCRKCIPCQYKRSQEWSIRNSLEAQGHEFKYFLTLTYSEDSLIHIQNKYNCKTLVLEDMQLFLKRLRKNTGQKFRYYLCGEYGSLKGRPHYHMLLYGLNIPDLDFLYKTDKGYNYYKSDFIQNCWGLGIVQISEFSDYNSMYTSRYCTKKIDFENNVLDVKKEFNTMSRRGGIGLEYYNHNKLELYGNDVMYYHFNGKTYKMKPLKFFDRLFDAENPEYYKFIKENRKKFALENNYFEKLETDLSFYEYLEMLERQQKDKIKGKRKVLLDV